MNLYSALRAPRLDNVSNAIQETLVGHRRMRSSRTRCLNTLFAMFDGWWVAQQKGRST